MIGGAAIGQHAVGEFIEGMGAPLVLPRLSRILSGGSSAVAGATITLIEVWFWNDGTMVLWNDDTFMECN